jgi:hypothetical protein
MRKVFACFTVAKSIMPLFPPALSSSEIVIEHIAVAAEILLKEFLLLHCWICAIPVTSDPFHDTPLRTSVLIISFFAGSFNASSEFFDLFFLWLTSHLRVRLFLFRQFRSVSSHHLRGGGIHAKLLDKNYH